MRPAVSVRLVTASVLLALALPPAAGATAPEDRALADGAEPGLSLAAAGSQSPGAAASATAVAPVAGRLTRDFDPPAQPWGAGHRGVGLAAAGGATVVAAMDGVVAFSGEVARRGWVTVDHGQGLATTYGVLDPRAVTAGERVRMGEPLGLLARDTGHLHWGARLDGEYIHPLALLGDWSVRLVRTDGGGVER